MIEVVIGVVALSGAAAAYGLGRAHALRCNEQMMRAGWEACRERLAALEPEVPETRGMREVLPPLVVLPAARELGSGPNLRMALALTAAKLRRVRALEDRTDQTDRTDMADGLQGEGRALS